MLGVLHPDDKHCTHERCAYDVATATATGDVATAAAASVLHDCACDKATATGTAMSVHVMWPQLQLHVIWLAATIAAADVLQDGMIVMTKGCCGQLKPDNNHNNSCHDQGMLWPAET